MWKNAPAGMDKSKSYSGVVDNGSRWGIKGSHELSDGLNAVYQFETKIDAANAGNPGGRLSYAGLSGGFGTVTMGQVWSASYNHIGGSTNHGYSLGGPDTSFRIGNAISYAVSIGSVSLQADVVANKTGGMSKKDSNGKEDKNIDASQIGATLQIGENGKVAFAHINDDAAEHKKNKASLVVGEYTVGGMTLHLGMGQRKTSDSRTGSFTDADFKAAIAASTNDAGATSTGNLPTATSDDADEAKARADLLADVAYGMANEVRDQKVKTVYYGASGSLGDTGVSYFLEFQNQKTSGKKVALVDPASVDAEADNTDPTMGVYDDNLVVQNVDNNKHTSWTIGLSRSLGTGTAVYLEHSEPDQDKTKATTVFGLQVNF